MNLPANQPDEDQPSPEPSATRETRVRKFCRVGRAVCWVVGIALALLALASLVIIDFVSAPAPVKIPPQTLTDPSQVGKTLEKSYFEFGAAYESPFPRFVVQHESSSTITGVDESLRIRSVRESSKTVYMIRSHNFGDALAEHLPARAFFPQANSPY